MGFSYISGTRTVGTGGVNANTLVQYDSSGNVVTVPVSATGILGIAVSTVAAASPVEVATRGVVSCVADNATTINNVVGVGTTTAGRCRDLGTTNVTSISPTTQVVGRWLSAVSAGATGSIQLFGPGHYGANAFSDSLTTNGDIMARIGGATTRLPLGSAGALLFAGSGTPAWSSTSGLVWDSANSRLGIGTASPTERIDVVGNITVSGVVNGGSGVTASTAANSTLGFFRVNPTVYGEATVGHKDLAAFATNFAFTQNASGNTAFNGTVVDFRIANNQIMRIAGSGSVGIGPSNTSPTGTLSVRDATPTTGNTLMTVRVGAGQSGNTQEWQDAAGAVLARVSQFGGLAAQEFFNLTNTFYQNGANVDVSNAGMYRFSNSSSQGGTKDTGIARASAGVLEVNSGTAGTLRGLRASYVQAGGTTFTASGCSNSTLVGGATAGRYTSGTTGTCTVTITMGNSATSTNGWSCSVSNRTTANLMRQTAATTTTATFEGVTVSGDVIGFGCIGN
jgi:hypothetical protein